MPERKRRKSRGKCLVWRGISTCKPSAEVAREGDFVVKLGTAQKCLLRWVRGPYTLRVLKVGVPEGHERQWALGQKFISSELGNFATRTG
jgi:hypothetical protein